MKYRAKCPCGFEIGLDSKPNKFSLLYVGDKLHSVLPIKCRNGHELGHKDFKLYEETQAKTTILNPVPKADQ